MTLATLNMDGANWDFAHLITLGDLPQLIKLKNRDTCVNLNRELTIAWFDDHEGDLQLFIDGHSYTFPQEIWHAVLSVTDQWLEEYLVAEFAEMFEDEPEAPQTAEVIQLFPEAA